MTYAYLRQLPSKNSIAIQQSVILSFALGKGLSIDKEVFEYSNRNYSIEERDQFEKFIHGLKEGDSIIVDEIWIMSEKMDEIVKVINCMLSRDITLYCASSQTIVNTQSLVCEIFPLLNTFREEQKKKQKQIGRPKGSRSISKFDKYQTQIIALLRDGLSVSAVSRELGVSRSSLKDYIESRGIREMIERAWIEISPANETNKVNEKILICPFEQETQENKGEQYGTNHRE